MVVHRLITHDMPVTLAETIGPPACEHHQHDTRGAALLTLPNIRTEKGRHSLSFSAVRMLNEVLQTHGTVSRAVIKKYLQSAQ